MTPNIKSSSHNLQSGPYDGVEMGGATCNNVTAAASTIHTGCGVLFLWRLLLFCYMTPSKFYSRCSLNLPSTNQLVNGKPAITGDSGMYECLSCRSGQLLTFKKENADGQLRVYIFGMVLMWRLSSGLSTPVTALVIFCF